jgi:UDP-N-acetylmuramoylalanine--D-glutamate ligase
VISFLQNQFVLVLGLGQSGLAMVRFCVAHGAKVAVFDTRPQAPGLEQLSSVGKDIAYLTSLPDDVLCYDQVLVSPGLSPNQWPLVAVEPQLQACGRHVLSEIEVFALALEDLKKHRGYCPKIVGVTGTNGKTTTTSLAHILCERAGCSVLIAGNISPAALDALQDAIQLDALPNIWVLELSSFQLQHTYSLQCDAAAVLNLTEDHLDWHGDMKAYAAAKERIFSVQTHRVLNRDDPWCFAMVGQNHTVTFGQDIPQQANSYGLLRENGLVWLVYAQLEEQELGRRQKKLAHPVQIKRLIPMDALQIKGLHNAMNALAALALCRALGLSLADLLHGLRQYRGEPHRLEYVTTVSGVDYIDDSKGTNVGATVAALKGLGQTAVLIAGGQGKGQSFVPLAQAVARHARAVVLIGQDSAEIDLALASTGVAVHLCDSLQTAVTKAASIAQAGDAVLLSPACASLDMFRNYIERAEVFIQTVREIAAQAGHLC